MFVILEFVIWTICGLLCLREKERLKCSGKLLGLNLLYCTTALLLCARRSGRVENLVKLDRLTNNYTSAIYDGLRGWFERLLSGTNLLGRILWSKCRWKSSNLQIIVEGSIKFQATRETSEILFKPKKWRGTSCHPLPSILLPKTTVEPRFYITKSRFHCITVVFIPLCKCVCLDDECGRLCTRVLTTTVACRYAGWGRAEEPERDHAYDRGPVLHAVWGERAAGRPARGRGKSGPEMTGTRERYYGGSYRSLALKRSPSLQSIS